MPQIREPLFWDDDDNNADHIWDRHKVSVDEVEEVIFEDADGPTYVAFWKGPYYVVLGATAGGDCSKSPANSFRATISKALCIGPCTPWT